MSHIEIMAPGLGSAERHEVPEDHALLVGRRPDATRLEAPAAAATVPSNSASQNHLLAWREAGAIVLRDLGSRNGSWLRLPPPRRSRRGGALR